jgi:hypothetical protein
MLYFLQELGHSHLIVDLFFYRYNNLNSWQKQYVLFAMCELSTIEVETA